jgi:glycosyltransferase involved in cell wall biosynthesis
LAGFSEDPVRALGLVPGGYLTLIARPEPENSVLEVVQAFSRQPRGTVLAVLGAYRDDQPYHRAVRAAAGAEVRFLGAIYDKPVIQALRAHSLAYVHGHRVGGTNPSLVEALGAGNAVIAHDNRFNRWVAADAAHYFADVDAAAAVFDGLLRAPTQLQTLRHAAVRRHREAFTWQAVLEDYERLLLGWQPKP